MGWCLFKRSFSTIDRGLRPSAFVSFEVIIAGNHGLLIGIDTGAINIQASHQEQRDLRNS
jgi:hypothetical protein